MQRHHAPCRRRWVQTTNEYLKTRNCLCGLVIVMDIRHPFKDSDCQLIEWTVKCELPIHILLTKADKLNNSEQKNTLLKVRKILKSYHGAIDVQVFSSLKKAGVQEARELLDGWFLHNMM